MYRFGKKSSHLLSTCDEKLQRVAQRAIKVMDFSILEGHRNQQTQDALFRARKSKLKWPLSKHNTDPSLAFDAVPYPIIWPDLLKRPNTYSKDLGRFYLLAGVILMAGFEEGVKLRWGGDWNGNFDFTDQSFDDLVHFEVNE
jgi:peptidoglycan L-alanyl-D-glutamate endopeptidase CwlK